MVTNKRIHLTFVVRASESKAWKVAQVLQERWLKRQRAGKVSQVAAWVEDLDDGQTPGARSAETFIPRGGTPSSADGVVVRRATDVG